MATRLYSVVIDAADPAALARWWLHALDGVRDAPGSAGAGEGAWAITFEAADEVVVEPVPEDDTFPALVFVPVPEPKSAKNRVHLDLSSDSPAHQSATVDRLVSLGAMRVDVGQGEVPWVVLADPEGNEFCVLEPRERFRGMGALVSVVVDAHDPAAMASFWAEASGWGIGTRSDEAMSLHRPEGRPPDVDFVRVPDTKQVKNRVHLDVAPFPDDDRDAEVDRLVALGARRVDVGQGDEVTWVVLADPEGNELCVLSPR